MSTILEIIERLEAASGPDREIDAAIDATLRVGKSSLPAWTWTNFPNWQAAKQGIVQVVHPQGIPGVWWESRPFTRSVEDATALAERMLPQWGRLSYWNNCQGHLARVEDNANPQSTGHDYEAIGKTAALALCMATLKALVDRPGMVRQP